MKRFKSVIGGLIVALALSVCTWATPPDTLDFGIVKFVKAREGLYHDPVKQVCLRQDTSGIYPSTVVFLDKVVFFNRDGAEIGRDSLPDTSGVRVTQSAHGEYIYIFGAPEDKPGGFHRVYTFNGKRILNQGAEVPVGTVGLGTPLEKHKAFLLGGYGKVTLTGFDSDVIAERPLLNKDLMEDGDIFAVCSKDENQFFVAANKFKLPVGQSTFNQPILYALDSDFYEVYRDTLQGLLVTSLDLSQNGRYLLLREESENGSLLWVLDFRGSRLTSFNNPKMIVFAADADYLIHLPHNAPPEVVSTADWQSVYQPRVSSNFSWVDASISDDGALGMLYNGSEIIILDIAKKSAKTLDFPFAFKSCQFYDNGQMLILLGEFGYEIYQQPWK